jgi:hypothetical protein
MAVALETKPVVLQQSERSIACPFCCGSGVVMVKGAGQVACRCQQQQNQQTFNGGRDINSDVRGHGDGSTFARGLRHSLTAE